MRPAATCSTTPPGRSTPTSTRDDVTFLGVPLAQMCLENFEEPRERILMKNIAYAGALVALLGIDMDIVAELLAEKFARNEALRDSNQTALAPRATTTRGRTSTCPLPFRLETMDANGDSILIDGNTADRARLPLRRRDRRGLVPDHAGDRGHGQLHRALRAYRREKVDSDDPSATDARTTTCIIQAEDELAAIGMVLGAGVERRARLHLHVGPGHLADERAARPRLLRRDPRGRHRRAARRARRPACPRARSRATS